MGKEERGENKAKERRTIRDDWDRRAVCCAWLLWDAVEKSGRKVCKLIGSFLVGLYKLYKREEGRERA